MSKKRLEEAKDYLEYWINNDLSLEWALSNEAKQHLKYLIEQAERVEELENKIDRIRFVNNDFYKQNKRYRDALIYVMKTHIEQYHDPKNKLEDIKFVVNEALEGEE